MSLLLKHGDILVGDPGLGQVIRGGFLGLEGDRIDYLGREEPEKTYDAVRDMSGCLLMPGLINCHTHSPMVLLRGVGSDLSLQDWLFGKILPIEERLTPDDILWGTRLALMEMLACGTTSFTDMYYFPHVTAQAVEECGMKANLCRPVDCQDPDLPGKDCVIARESIAFHRDFDGRAQGRLLVDFGIHSEYLSTPKLVEYYAGICKEEGGRIHLHLSETAREHEECKERYGKTPAAWFAQLGAFDSPVLAAHCVHCEEEDLALMAEKGACLVHNPTSNMKLGSGFAPVARALELGLDVAIGTDGAASNNNLNMLEEMHLASLIHKGYHQDPTLVTPGDILRMATIRGAKAQGRPDTGRLELGMKADLVAVSFEGPHMTPAPDPLPMLVYAAQGSDVCLTMVDGQILYDQGSYPTLDAQRIRHQVAACLKRLLS